MHGTRECLTPGLIDVAVILGDIFQGFFIFISSIEDVQFISLSNADLVTASNP